MTDLFEPLNMTEGQKEQSDFKRIALSQTKEELSDSRNSSAYTLPDESSTPTPPQNAEAHPDECAQQSEDQAPKLFVDREGDRIVRIRVLCGCGKSTTLKCTYPDFSSNTPEQKDEISNGEKTLQATTSPANTPSADQE